MNDGEGLPLRKMMTALEGHGASTPGTVHYTLRLGDERHDMAPLLGTEVAFRATGVLSCTVCGRRVKKFYGQGFCFPCFRDAPEAAECIVRPELCRAHLGEGRDPAWEREHHDAEHVVYLAWTGGLKVGVTRATQVPVRWLDQGATAALPLARLPYRQLAGQIEVALKQYFSDKTNWRAMLRDQPAPDGLLVQAREQALAALPAGLLAYALPEEAPVAIRYPVQAWPTKVVSVQLERQPTVVGRLVGIKGQYLIWADGRVLNVRNHAGHHVVWEGHAPGS